MDSKVIIQIIPLLSPFILLVGVIMGITLFKRLNRLHKFLFTYIILMLFVDVFSKILWVIQHNNQVILLIYSLIELCFFIYFYKKHLLKKKSLALTILGVFGIAYIIGEIVYYFILNNVSATNFQPYSKVVDNTVIILLALTFLQEKMSDFTVSKWENFRLNLVILVFFTLNTLIFLPFNFLVNESSGVKFYFWTGNVIMLLAFYSFLISEIWRNAKTKKIST